MRSMATFVVHVISCELGRFCLSGAVRLIVGVDLGLGKQLVHMAVEACHRGEAFQAAQCLGATRTFPDRSPSLSRRTDAWAICTHRPGETDSLTTNLDRTADTGNNVQQPS